MTELLLEESTHRGVNQRSKYVTQVQQRPESPTVTLTWHTYRKYAIHRLWSMDAVLCLLYCSRNFCIIILRARHDHNKTAPCGMIFIFIFFKSEFELNLNT